MREIRPLRVMWRELETGLWTDVPVTAPVPDPTRLRFRVSPVRTREKIGFDVETFADARNRKLASLSPFLRYPHLPQPSGSISPLHQLLAKPFEKSLQPLSFDRLKLEAYQLAKQNNGAPGVDGVTQSVSRLQTWIYNPRIAKLVQPSP